MKEDSKDDRVGKAARLLDFGMINRQKMESLDPDEESIPLFN